MKCDNEPNETNELYRGLREDQRARRAARLPGRQANIEALNDAGFSVRKLTEYQFRVNESVDLYPTHARYHNLRTGQRGRYRGDLVSFMRSALKPTDSALTPATNTTTARDDLPAAVAVPPSCKAPATSSE